MLAAPVAQLVEHLTFNQGAAGSIPVRRTNLTTRRYHENYTTTYATNLSWTQTH